MPHKSPLQVGLTGGIGAGKSTVARIFALLGVPVYESDDEAKKLYFLPEIKEAITNILGPQAYLTENEINRTWIARQLFENEPLRREVNALLHPAVKKHYKEWLEKQTHPYVLKVAALLFEAKIDKELDLTLLVLAPKNVRLERTKIRDKSRNEGDILKIMESQMADEEKQKLANGIIENDGETSLIKQVLEWDEKVRTLIGANL